MKNGSTILKLVVVGVLGAAAMVGCSDDEYRDPEAYDKNGCRSVFNNRTDKYEDVCDGVCIEVTDEITEEVSTKCEAATTVPSEQITTTSEDPTTTVEETTTTVEEAPTTVPRPTTTVKKTTAATAPPTNAPATQAPTTAPTTTTTVPTTTTTVPTTTTTVPTTTTTAPTTEAPTTAPGIITLPPVNVSFMWSSDNGCGGLGHLILDVDVTGATSAGTVSVSVNGSPVSSYGGPTTFGVGDTSMIMFDQWPILSDGTYPVTITASSATQGPTTRTTSVTYNCPP
jgi:hypothetical protein